MTIRKYKGKICECGAIKDARAIRCAKCAGVSVPRKDNGVVYLDDSLIRDTIRDSVSFVDVAKKIKYNRNTLRKYVLHNNIDISHFRGAKGRDVPEDKVFVLTDKRRNGTVKKYALLYGVLKDECTICSLNPLWNGKVLNLELHHINGNPFDNTKENLQLLCPNCHSQTDNNKGKNSFGIKKQKKIK